jgi:hypothetical protein
LDFSTGLFLLKAGEVSKPAIPSMNVPNAATATPAPTCSQDYRRVDSLDFVAAYGNDFLEFVIRHPFKLAGALG